MKRAWVQMTTIGRCSSFVQYARDELELVRSIDLATVHIDHAIAVEEEGAAGHVFDRVDLLFMNAPAEISTSYLARKNRFPPIGLLLRNGQAGRFISRQRISRNRHGPHPLSGKAQTD
jgi:hypothetical protein